MTLPDRLATENGLVFLRTFARLLFASLVFSYFYLIAQPDALPLAGIFLFAGYLFAQGLLLSRLVPAREWIALIIDGAAIAVAVALDPSTPAPTLALFLVSLMSAGMLRGLSRYFLLLLGNAGLITLLVVIGQARGIELSIASSFLLALIGVCALYLGVLIYRQALMTRKAKEATWKDPETGLISRHALLATAGWLLPLHDRLAANLSVALVTPAQSGQLKELADLLSLRLRKSDIAARYDDDIIALLLPSTALTAAENLITDLRDSGKPFYAAVITLLDDEQGLEDTLSLLHTTLGRAYGNSEHWLVHARGNYSAE